MYLKSRSEEGVRFRDGIEKGGIEVRSRVISGNFVFLVFWVFNFLFFIYFEILFVVIWYDEVIKGF